MAITTKSHQCQDCDKSYKAYESLCRHRRVHRQGRSFVCAICKAQFLRRDILKRHEKIHTRGRGRGRGRGSTSGSTIPFEDRLAVGDDDNEVEDGPSQRLRASRSCDQCSKRKIRCSKGHVSPSATTRTCSQCQMVGSDCTYLRRSARTSVILSSNHSMMRGDEDDDDDDADEATQDETQVAETCLDGFGEPAAAEAGGIRPDIANISNEQRAQQEYTTSTLGSEQFDIATALCNFATQDIQAYSTPSLTHSGTSLAVLGQSVQEDELPAMMNNWHAGLSDDAQCWNWILDEFIPPSPQMISSRASPSLFTSSRQDFDRTAMSHHPSTTVLNTDMTSTQQQQQSVEWELRQSCVFLVVHNCTTSSFHAVEDTDSLMRKEGQRVASVFPIEHPPELQLFDWLLGLFFQHFHPLWPTFPAGYFDKMNCPPELYLTLVIIGAHYGGKEANLFGRMAHEVLRGSLITNNLDLRSKNPSSEAICQVLMLNKATALYFGQRRAFFIAQQLGALSLVHARRLGLFGSLGTAYDNVGKASSGTSSSTSSTPHRSNIRKEARRRLAFGIMRLDVYLSLLLGQKPALSWEEMRLQPLANWSDSSSTESDRESSDVIFSDLVSLYLYGDESPPILRPLDLELVLMGLVSEVWSLGHDRHAFQRFTGTKDICITTFDSREREDSASHSSPSSLLLTHVNTKSFDLQKSKRTSFVLLKNRWSSVLRAIRRWQFAFNSVQQTPFLSQERSRVFSCRILYHLILLHLFADLNELHTLTTLDAASLSSSLSSTTPAIAAATSLFESSPILSIIRRWLKCEDCESAVSQAISLVETIQDELQVESSQRASFNLLAFIGLYHTAVLFWAYIQLNNDKERHFKVAGMVVAEENRRAIMQKHIDLFNQFESPWPIASNFRDSISQLADKQLGLVS